MNRIKLIDLKGEVWAWARSLLADSWWASRRCPA